MLNEKKHYKRGFIPTEYYIRWGQLYRERADKEIEWKEQAEKEEYI